MTSTNALHEGPLVAVIGDVLGSRDYALDARVAIQRELETVLEDVAYAYSDVVVSQPVITIGDEFQMLLANADILPDLVWGFATWCPHFSVRFGVGCGELYTPVAKSAIGMDGPVFHNARQAIEIAKQRQWLGGVFVGFGSEWDPVLDGFARLLEHRSGAMTRKQREVVNLLRDGMSQTAIAEQLGISKQSVNDHVNAVDWESLRTGEAAWRVALRMACGAAMDGDELTQD